MKPREIVPRISLLSISVLLLMVNTAASQQPITLHKIQVDDQNKQTSLETYLESKNRHFRDGELIADVNFLMKNLISSRKIGINSLSVLSHHLAYRSVLGGSLINTIDRPKIIREKGITGKFQTVVCDSSG
jgi:hypothetical protein